MLRSFSSTYTKWSCNIRKKIAKKFRHRVVTIIFCLVIFAGIKSWPSVFKFQSMRPCQGRGGGGGGGDVARLNFKTSRVGVYKCLSLIVGFAVTVAIWSREVASCRDFILRAVATFWNMSLVGIYSISFLVIRCNRKKVQCLNT